MEFPCNACRVLLDRTYENFGKNCQTLDGLNYRCRSCTREYNNTRRDAQRLTNPNFLIEQATRKRKWVDKVKADPVLMAKQKAKKRERYLKQKLLAFSTAFVVI